MLKQAVVYVSLALGAGAVMTGCLAGEQDSSKPGVEDGAEIEAGEVSEVSEVSDGLPSIDLASENAWADSTKSADDQAIAAARSQGFYSFPYEAGTEVKVSRDHLTHTPADRIDMSGRSGGPYRVVAAASGRVRFVEDSHRVNGGCENNNYVWIEHSNGEWTKYSHIAYHSASVSAGLSAGQSVRAGQFLGIESDVGCASGDHVHFEVAVPTDPADPINPVGGYIKGSNLIPKVCGISGQTFVAGETYVVPAVRPGLAEYARHGLADSAFQAEFTAAANCGYTMDWNDGFDRGGEATFNVLFHPNPSPAVSWLSHRRVTAAELDGLISSYVGAGYALVHLDAYNVGAAVRYAAIFKRGAAVPQTRHYHGLTAAQHQAEYNTLVGGGWRPRQVSVAAVNGVRTYAAVFTLGSIGSYVVDSTQTSAEYQANYTANKTAGRRLIYLNSYVINDEPRYTAIWASSAPADVFAQHGMSSASYQANWQIRTSLGWTTGAVTGVEISGVPSYAAYWVD